MPNARATVLFLLMTLFLALSVSAQTFRPGGSWTVKDANNQVVGQWLGDSRVSTVINGRPVALIIVGGLLTLETEGYLYYDQANCQGNAYVQVPNLDAGAGMTSDGTIRIADTTKPIVSMTTLSVQDRPSFGGGCTNSSYSHMVRQTQAGPNITQLFVGPFSVVETAPAPASAPMLSPMVVLALLSTIVIIAIIRSRAT